MKLTDLQQNKYMDVSRTLLITLACRIKAHIYAPEFQFNDHQAARLGDFLF